MPYIIRAPGVPQPFVTNDPCIYLDCLKVCNWECESRPFCDTYCQTLRDEEELRHLSDRRRDQLEVYWLQELEQRKDLEKVFATADGEKK
jgi:hypothetical protein